MNCVLCDCQTIQTFSDKKRTYVTCCSCGGISVLANSFLTKQKQKERYLLHKNSLANSGYRSFLEQFIDPLLGYAKNPETILDYGCGPKSTLCELLELYKNMGKLTKNTEIRGWDPFFSPDTPFFIGGAALVTCLEVAEHFENPEKDFSLLATTLKPGGYVAIGTELIPQNTPFLDWWYKEDATHVTFYTATALKAVAQRAHLQFVQTLTPRLFLFQKVV